MLDTQPIGFNALGQGELDDDGGFEVDFLVVCAALPLHVQFQGKGQGGMVGRQVLGQGDLDVSAQGLGGHAGAVDLDVGFVDMGGQPLGGAGVFMDGDLVDFVVQVADFLDILCWDLGLFFLGQVCDAVYHGVHCVFDFFLFFGGHGVVVFGGGQLVDAVAHFVWGFGLLWHVGIDGLFGNGEGGLKGEALVVLAAVDHGFGFVDAGCGLGVVFVGHGGTLGQLSGELNAVGLAVCFKAGVLEGDAGDGGFFDGQGHDGLGALVGAAFGQAHGEVGGAGAVDGDLAVFIHFGHIGVVACVTVGFAVLEAAAGGREGVGGIAVGFGLIAQGDGFPVFLPAVRVMLVLAAV